MSTERAASSVLLGVARAGDRLVAVGERGVVVLSDDHGRTWRQARVPVSVTLTTVAFADKHTGFAAGHFGVVLRTEDGGATWLRELDGAAAASLALAAATQDGDVEGIAAARALVSDGPDKPFLALRVGNPYPVLAIGAYNLAFGKLGAAAPWAPMIGLFENPAGMHLYGIADIGSHRFVVGEQGTVLVRSQPGGSFEVLPSPYDGTWFGAIPTAGGGLLAFGLRGNAFRSVDLGRSWSRVDTGTAESLTAGTVLTDGRIVLVGVAGQVQVGDAAGTRFRTLPVEGASTFADVIQAADGGLVLVGARGVLTIPFAALAL